MVESILENAAVVFHFVRLVTSYVLSCLREFLLQHQFGYSGLCTDYLCNLPDPLLTSQPLHSVVRVPMTC